MGCNPENTSIVDVRIHILVLQKMLFTSIKLSLPHSFTQVKGAKCLSWATKHRSYIPLPVRCVTNLNCHSLNFEELSKCSIAVNIAYY